jgi:hypothetical protein
MRLLKIIGRPVLMKFRDLVELGQDGLEKEMGGSLSRDSVKW